MRKPSSNANLSLVQLEKQLVSECSDCDVDFQVTQKFNRKLSENEEKKLLDSMMKSLLGKYTTYVYTGSKGIMPYYIKLFLN